MRKGTRVSFRARVVTNNIGEVKTILGVISKGTTSKNQLKRVKVRGDNNLGYLCQVGSLQLSNEPMPKGVKAPTSHKKGSRVTWTESDGTVMFGLVVKGGSNKVHVVPEGNPDIEQRGHPSCFEPAPDRVLPKDEPSVMDDYKIIGFKEFKAGAHEGIPFVATIVTPSGVKIKVDYDAWGGPYRYDWQKKVAYDQFQADIKTWHEQFNSSYVEHCDGDLWVEWWQHKRPLGVLAKDYLKNEEMDAIVAARESRTEAA